MTSIGDLVKRDRTRLDYFRGLLSEIDEIPSEYWDGVSDFVGAMRKWAESGRTPSEKMIAGLENTLRAAEAKLARAEGLCAEDLY